MRYITVKADTRSTALQQLRETYGDEAWVYTEKEIPAASAFKRLFGKKQYQIVAGIPEKSRVRKGLNDLEKMVSKDHSALVKEKNAELWKQALDSTRESAKPSAHITSMVNDYNAQNKEVFLQTLNKELQTRPRLAEPKMPQQKMIENNIGEQKNYSPELDRLGRDVDVIKNHLSSLSYDKATTFKEKELQELFVCLQEQEFSDDWAKHFVELVRNDLAKNYWNDKKEIYQKALLLLEKKIPIAQSSAAKKVLALVGPTGVGKTTTLAKLSARMQLQENRNISLVTLDNYRIAATEQLRLFAGILEIPVHVFSEPQKFHEFVENDSSDLILVDTTGFSHNNQKFLLEQRDFFSSAKRDLHGNIENKIAKKIEKHLVLSATTRAKDARLIVERFKEQNVDKLILTKLDETFYYGAFVELAENKNLPFSFFSTGQEVPRDHKIADGEFLAKKILSGYNT